MVAPVAKTSRMRQRKLNLKQGLQVVREDDLESFEANEPTLKEIQTGVEAHEEQEHHLQAVISAAQAAAAGGGATTKASIPTRGTDAADLPYDTFYHLKFAQPATYIRFSSTVEDCINGPVYDVADEDDDFLRTLNEKLRAQAQQASSRPTSRSAAAASESIPQSCDEAQFEADMAAFEIAAKAAAPFSNSVTGDLTAPILSLDEQLSQLSEHLPEEPAADPNSRSHALLRTLATYIYPHWQSRRSQNDNNPLAPAVKVKVLETGDALDDNDPYVCFRRREVRAVRKTRGRDAQSSEKLRLLRRQLEDARQLVHAVLAREKLRKEVLSTNRILFESRLSLRGVKRSLPPPYRDGDEELLVDQKRRPPQPAKPPADTSAHAPGPPVVPQPVPAGMDLQSIEAYQDRKKTQQLAEITIKVQQHKQWNSGYIDDTTTPVKPLPPDGGIIGGFRAARTEYLPTPPASVASGDLPTDVDVLDNAQLQDGVQNSMQLDQQPGKGGMTASPPEDVSSRNLTSGPTTGASTPAEFALHAGKSGEFSVVRTPKQPVHVRYASPSSPQDPTCGRSPSFRRRIGRGGRVWIDRRNMQRSSNPSEDESESDPEMSTGLTPSFQDRFRFDHDSDDDIDDDPGHVHKVVVDPYDWRSMFLRAQNCPMNQATAGGHNAAALAQHHHAQLQKQKQLQMQAHAQGYTTTTTTTTAAAAAAAATPAGQIGNPTPQTLRQQVAAAQAQQMAAVAQTQATGGSNVNGHK